MLSIKIFNYSRRTMAVASTCFLYLLMTCAPQALAEWEEQAGRDGQAAGRDSCTVLFDQPERTLRIIISDSSGGRVSGATVRVVCGALHREMRTDPDGISILELPPGRYYLQIEAPGFARVSRRATVLTEPDATELNLALTVAGISNAVTVTANTGYVAVGTATGTKTDTPLIETPQSISVITRDEMTQRGVQTLNEALRYTPGVSVELYGMDTRFDWLQIRGFDENQYGVFRDGSRWDSTAGRIDTYGIEEVSVLRGPSSVLYGQNNPGGLINLITKRPPSEALREIQLQFGSYNNRQVQADFGGPIGDHWRYRLTGLSRNADTQVDFVPDNRRFIAPALTWVPTENTTLTLLGDYQHDGIRWTQFLPIYGTLLPNPNGKIPVNLFTGEPGFDYVKRNQHSAGYLLDHRLNGVWSLHQNFRSSSFDYDGTTVYGTGLEPDLRTLNRLGIYYFWDSGLYTLDNRAQARFRTRGLDHSVLVGLDYSHTYGSSVNSSGAAPSIDVFNPVYGQTVGPLAVFADSDTRTVQTGIYLQDQIKFKRNWVITLSGREDWVGTRNRDFLVDSTDRQNDNKFTGRGGLVYLSEIGLAPYFSYSTSFLPTSGLDFYGNSFRPTTGRQEEAGVKYQPKLWNGFITASFFNLTQQNVKTPDPANPLNTIQLGEVRSRRFELEWVASLKTGLNLHVSYAYTNIKVTQTTIPEEIGKRVPLVADHTASALAEYTIPKGRFAGLGGGLGVRYTGDKAGNPDNSIVIPVYTLLDASLHFGWKRLRFGVNASNLTDKRYIAVCNSVAYCNFGYARNVIGNVRFRW
jgi:iron complex outermembrane recepter protein